VGITNLKIEVGNPEEPENITKYKEYKMNSKQIIFSLLISIVCCSLLVSCQVSTDKVNKGIASLEKALEELEKADIVASKDLDEIKKFVKEAKSLNEQGKLKEAIKAVKDAKMSLAKKMISGAMSKKKE